MKYTFMYEHEDGSHGHYVKADTRKEAEALFVLKCEENGINEDEYGLVRICKGGTNGEWVWDVHTWEPMPQEFQIS